MAFHCFPRLSPELRSRIWMFCVGAKKATEIRLLYRDDDDEDEDSEHALTIPEDYGPEELGYGMATCPAVYACQESLAVWHLLGAFSPTPLSAPPPANVNWQKVSLVCLHDEMGSFNNTPLSLKIQNLVFEKTYIHVFTHSESAFQRLCRLPERFPALRSVTILTFFDIRKYNDDYFFSTDCWFLMHLLHYDAGERQFTLTFGHATLAEEQWLTEENFTQGRYWATSLTANRANYGRLVEFVKPVLKDGRWVVRVEESSGPLDIEEAKMVDQGFF